MQPYLNSLILSRTHLIEILAEAKNFNTTLREWKRVKHAYKLADGNYLFSWIPHVPDQPYSPIDFNLIEREARELRKRLKTEKRRFLKEDHS